MKKTFKKGFTLVELVIVIAVIAILSAILIPTFGNVISNARKSAANSEASNSITAYLADHAQEGFEFNNGYVVVLEKRADLITKAENATTYTVNRNETVAYVFKYENGRLGDSIEVTDFDKQYASAQGSTTTATYKFYELSVGSDNATVQVDGANLKCTNAYLLDGKITTTTTEDGKEVVNTVSAKILFLAEKPAA